MAQQTPNQNPPQEPFIPPRYLLVIAALGFIAALVVKLTQPEFSVVGYGGVGIGILALLMWALLAPQEARSVIAGRTARFGGTSLIVTLVLLVALIGIYVVVRNAKLSVDLTQTDTYSLTAESRQAIAALGAEPGTPKVNIIAFFGPSQAGTRDQATLLFDDYKATSNGKIDYQFVDPEQFPQQASLYKVTRGGQIAVVKIGDDGQPDTENARLVNSVSQQDLTNAVLRVSASGVFNAYFLQVQDGEAAQMSTLKQFLTQAYDWNVQDVTLLQLTSPDSQYKLNDPNATGQVLVIPGGSGALADSELQVIEDYLNGGGSVVIFAGTLFNTDQTSLATADNLSTYLFDNFGLKFDKDVVIDQVQAYQSPLNPGATDLDRSSFITTNSIPSGQGALVFEVPNSITVADTPPANVTVTTLARSSDGAYAKTDLQAVIDGNIDKTDGDAAGPLVLAAAAENSQTHGRVILLGSTSVGSDTYALFQQFDNFTVAFNSMVWATHFDDFATQVTVVQQQRPQDAPIIASEQDLRNINFITIVLLPFGVLAIGVLVWWNNRERAR
ncbi:MAG: Gldg family protein [Anaerolineae bacterium]